jgi:hypothetical protein
MKPRILSAGLLLLAASAGLAQVGSPPAPAAPPSTPPAPDGTSAPAAKAGDSGSKTDTAKSTGPDAKKAPGSAKKKEEPPAKVDGIAISRANGGFLGLQILNNNFLLTFYDAKKKKVAPDVARAVLRWPVKYQPGPERTVLNPSGPYSLGSGKTVRPPFVFAVHISLMVEGKDDPVEDYTVEYHGE